MNSKKSAFALRIAVVLILFALSAGSAGVVAEEAENTAKDARFQACENCSGAGFYWVDTTCGKVFFADPAKMQWVFLGSPEGAQPGPIGSYLPRKNKSGEGLFILDASSGEGWFADGKQWKKMGRPELSEKK